MKGGHEPTKWLQDLYIKFLNKISDIDSGSFSYGIDIVHYPLHVFSFSSNTSTPYKINTKYNFLIKAHYVLLQLMHIKRPLPVALQGVACIQW